MRRSRLISLALCAFLLIANLDVIYAKAAPLSKADSIKIADSIERSYTSGGSVTTNYYTHLANGELTFLDNFTITNLEEPKHGKLLDSTATVVANNGVTWDIPVLWVNQNGELIKIAIEIDDEIRSYPIFVFYLPEGYSLMFGDSSSFNISMPSFVCNLISLRGVATLANPYRGITYITPLLPGKDKLIATTPTDYYGDSSENGYDSQPDNVIPYDTGGSDGGGKDSPTPSGNKQQYKDYNPNIDEETAKEISEQHANDKAISELGEENIAWFVSYIKDIIEPEAVNILLQKFPAYRAAADSGELGKDLGCYIYYDDVDLAIASIGWKLDDEEDLGYKLSANGYYFYKYDSYAGTTKTDVDFDDDANIYLDRTMVHEVMHVMMDDYTRAGMTGNMYNEADGDIVGGNDNRFPKWFIEGIATSVGSPYQHWVFSFRHYYDYDSTEKSYDSDTIKSSYEGDRTMQLSYSDSGASDTRAASYMNGWLATVYLGALASETYDGNSAMTDKGDGTASFNSQYVLNGLNHILEELHGGKSLDDVIREISTDANANIIYDGTDDFTNKFIASTNNVVGDDNGASLDFCSKFLNYLETVSDDTTKTYANGSVLVNFTDTTELLLSADLLKNMPEVYVLADTSDYTKSTADEKTAYASGGKHEDGVIEDPNAPSAINGAIAAAPENGQTGEGNVIADITEKEYFEEESKKGEPGIEIIIEIPEEETHICEICGKVHNNKEHNETAIIADTVTPLANAETLYVDDNSEPGVLVSSISEAIDLGIEQCKEENAVDNEDVSEPDEDVNNNGEETETESVAESEQEEIQNNDSATANYENCDTTDETTTTSEEDNSDSNSPEEALSDDADILKESKDNEKIIEENAENNALTDKETSQDLNDEEVEKTDGTSTDATEESENVDNPKAEEGENQQEADTIDEETSKLEATEEAEETEDAVNDDLVVPEAIVISEADPVEDDNNNNENSNEEQILDAIPETGIHEEEDSSQVVPLITH